ncbi:MAG TPA: DUF5985 family protein [Planctomycetota bacterium]|nr:DUF5985 family protein [Planctomycetota bacterium]
MLREFLWGALTMAALVAGLHFARFFSRTRERLFLALAATFWILALNWTLLAVLDPDDESRHYVMLVRLLAFVVLIAGIVDKNRRR